MDVASVPISPNVTDPNAWGDMIVKVGVPMGCLIIFILITVVFAWFMLRWTLGPNGFIRNGFIKWVDAQVDAINGLKADVHEIKETTERVTVDHATQGAVHKATIMAGHHALSALGKIGQKANAGIEAEIEAAHASLNQA